MAVVTHDLREYRQWAPDTLALNLVGDRWALPIVRELANGALRRAELQRRLAHAGNHIDRRLVKMVDDGLVWRIEGGTRRKPELSYELTELGRDALPVVAALARFGLRHCMRDPTEDQYVSLRTLLGLLPVLLEPDVNIAAAHDPCTVELMVAQIDLSDHEGGPTAMRNARTAGNSGCWTLTINSSEVAIAEGGPVERADARVCALAQSWVEAIVAGGRRGFTIDGDYALGDGILDVLNGYEGSAP